VEGLKQFGTYIQSTCVTYLRFCTFHRPWGFRDHGPQKKIWIQERRINRRIDTTTEWRASGLKFFDKHY